MKNQESIFLQHLIHACLFWSVEICCRRSCCCCWCCLTFQFIGEICVHLKKLTAKLEFVEYHSMHGLWGQITTYSSLFCSYSFCLCCNFLWFHVLACSWHRNRDECYLFVSSIHSHILTNRLDCNGMLWEYFKHQPVWHIYWKN